MRTLMKVTVPVDSGNASIQEGRLGPILEGVFGRIRPEATYFLTEQGCRTALVFFDLTDPSQIPAIAEPLFTGLNASVEFTPVMNADELRRGLEAVALASTPISAAVPASV